ncbi:MAG: hypothetical protein ABIS50_10020 [Luteolibacter sp.]|uniref:hypothetical protein n=1 Tax=Luteolibacter sp. TaxID=1962973 RepID=UPI003263B5B8
MRRRSVDFESKTLLTTTTIVSSSATSLTISFLKRSGVGCTVESTTDLTHWSNGTVTPTVSADQTNKISSDYTRV